MVRWKKKERCGIFMERTTSPTACNSNAISIGPLATIMESLCICLCLCLCMYVNILDRKSSGEWNYLRGFALPPTLHIFIRSFSVDAGARRGYAIIWRVPVTASNFCVSVSYKRHFKTCSRGWFIVTVGCWNVGKAGLCSSATFLKRSLKFPFDNLSLSRSE